jgi:hypothetical protein
MTWSTVGIEVLTVELHARQPFEVVEEVLIFLVGNVRLTSLTVAALVLAHERLIFPKRQASSFLD